MVVGGHSNVTVFHNFVTISEKYEIVVCENSEAVLFPSSWSVLVFEPIFEMLAEQIDRLHRFVYHFLLCVWI